MTIAPLPTNAQLLEGAAQAFLPLAGTYGVMADSLLTAGLTYWAEFQAKKASGQLTMDDLNAAAAKTTTDLETLRQAVIASGTPV